MKKGKKLTVAATAVLALAGIVLAASAARGNALQKKLPALSAEDAIKYTLRNNARGLITVGTVQNGELSYTVYDKGGYATYDVYRADGAEASGELHTYEIGSLTKTFTAALVCQAVRGGKIALDAGIDAYLDLPAKPRYPTIRELLTHTSGYKGYYFEPPMARNFLAGGNSFRGITREMLLSRLGKVDADGRENGFNYSNFGYATLGLVLEKACGADYQTLAGDFLAGLGLEGTKLSDGTGDLGRLWKWLPSDVYMPAGALTSDIRDMLKYAKLLLEGAVCGGESLSVLKEVNATPAQYEALGIRMDGICYGWIFDAEHGIIWHNGGTSDYNSYLGLDVARQTAVVVLSNLPPSYRIPATVIGAKTLLEMQN